MCFTEEQTKHSDILRLLGYEWIVNGHSFRDLGKATKQTVENNGYKPETFANLFMSWLCSPLNHVVSVLVIQSKLFYVVKHVQEMFGKEGLLLKGTSGFGSQGTRRFPVS